MGTDVSVTFLILSLLNIQCIGPIFDETNVGRGIIFRLAILVVMVNHHSHSSSPVSQVWCGSRTVTVFHPVSRVASVCSAAPIDNQSEDYILQ